MPKTKVQKKETVTALSEKLGRMRSMVFANYEGLPVKDIEALRKELKKEGIEYTVTKKTLLSRAAAEAKLNFDPQELPGNFATVISYGDEVAPARVISLFAKTHDMLKIVAGVLEGKLIDSKATLALSKLPSKQELLGMLVGTLNAPVSGFVNVLAGNLRGLVTVLSAIKDKK